MSEVQYSVEHDSSVDTAAEARQFLAHHHEYREDYREWLSEKQRGVSSAIAEDDENHVSN